MKKMLSVILILIMIPSISYLSIYLYLYNNVEIVYTFDGIVNENYQNDFKVVAYTTIITNKTPFTLSNVERSRVEYNELSEMDAWQFTDGALNIDNNYEHTSYYCSNKSMEDDEIKNIIMAKCDKVHFQYFVFSYTLSGNWIR